MTLLHDAYIALLSGLTYKTGDEIHWHDENVDPITVELFDVEAYRYIVRRYREDDSLCIEKNYLKDQLHGKSIGWYDNGELHWEADYAKGKLHGKYRWWDPNGQLKWEKDCLNGKLHGNCTWWHPNGQLHCEADYAKGKLHGKDRGWHGDGTLWYEEHYINGSRVTREYWEQHNESTT